VEDGHFLADIVVSKSGGVFGGKILEGREAFPGKGRFERHPVIRILEFVRDTGMFQGEEGSDPGEDFEIIQLQRRTSRG